MRKEIISILILLALLLPSLASAVPEEAFGTVTNVVDGDTIDVLLQVHDDRIYGDTIRVRLADIDTPEMDTPNGPIAKQYTNQGLQSNTVYLDLDDKTGKDSYGRWVAVVYLQKPNGILENFNKILVDAGQACIWDFDNNEFNPADWWDGQIPAEACIKGDSLVPIVAPAVSTSSSGPFVGSSKSNKYHYPSCQWAKKINPANEIWFSSSEDARAHGYVPCKVCSPP